MKFEQPVSILDSAMTRFGDRSDLSFEGLIEEVLGHLDGSLEGVQAVYVASMLAGTTAGFQHLSAQMCQIMGRDLPVVPVEAACASGGVAVHQACKDVAAGYYEDVLVIGAEKMTEHSPDFVNQALMGATSLEERMTGISFAGLYGLIADRYLSEYGWNRDALQVVPELMHRQGATNPKAQFQKAVSREIIAKSREIAAPLRLFDCSPLTDGAAVVRLGCQSSEIQISQSALMSTVPGLADRRSLTSFPTTVAARAQLDLPSDWTQRLLVGELHDCFSVALVIALEDLGLAERGQGVDLVQKALSGELNWQINPSGGLKACGHPVGATGVKQIHSVSEWLKNQPKTGYGLAHNMGGTGGTAVVHLIEKNA